MSAIGESMVRRFQADFIEGVDVKVDWNMEGVGVVVAVGDARNHTKTLAVDFDKSSGQAFCRGGDEREVELSLFAFCIHSGAHVTDDLQSQILRVFALSVVLTNQSGECFGKSDKTNGECAVL